MPIIGLLIFVIGAACFLLELTGANSFVPLLADLNWPLPVWGGIALVGLVTYYMTRRPRD